MCCSYGLCPLNARNSCKDERGRWTLFWLRRLIVCERCGSFCWPLIGNKLCNKPFHLIFSLVPVLSFGLPRLWIGCVLPSLFCAVIILVVLLFVLCLYCVCLFSFICLTTYTPIGSACLVCLVSPPLTLTTALTIFLTTALTLVLRYHRPYHPLT